MKVASNLRRVVRRLRQRQQLRLLDQIDLVEDQHLRLPDLFELLQQRLGVVVEARLGVDQHRDDVGVVRAAPGGRHHGAVEPPPRRENSRRVEEHELGAALHRDAAQQRARGLHLGRDDRDLAADQRIDQRRFAGVGRADQRDEAAARGVAGGARQPSARSVFTPSRLSMAAAAACSATRLERPSPSAGSLLGSTTATRNSGSWCGPVRSTSR